jgi:ankyrin repeat protein
VQHFQKRYLFLLNDVLLITSQHTTTSLMKSQDKYGIHQVLPLDKVCVNNMSYLEPHEMNAFQVICNDRIFEFLAESESEKRIWVEKILFAVHSTYKRLSLRMPVGWQHRVHQGTIHSAAYLNDVDKLNFHLTLLSGRSPDIVDECGMCPIHWAAIGGHRSAVAALLDAGSEVDCLNNGLNSSLLLAASQGHEMVVNVLLERGADPFLRNLKDRDALFMSSLYSSNAKGLAKIFMFLHFRGVDFNRLDSTGSSPLHECAARNLPRPVRLLVDTGAEVNNKHGRTGVTPLQLACSSSTPDVETIRSLLEKGAYPNWRDANDMTAFDHVLRKSMVRIPILLCC